MNRLVVNGPKVVIEDYDYIFGEIHAVMDGVPDATVKVVFPESYKMHERTKKRFHDKMTEFMWAREHGKKDDNFSIFQFIESDDHCDGDHSTKCKAMERVTAALDYYHFLVVAPMATKYGKDPRIAFTSFCLELYPKKSLLNDYIHWVLHHNDPDSVMAMRQQLHFVCESAKRCGATTRHYRDRRDDVHEAAVPADDAESNWFVDKMDCIHFNVYHLHELGLRVSKETMENELEPDGTKQNESESVDLALKRMSKVIQTKRAMFTTERLDGAANSKFTLQIDEHKRTDGLLQIERLVGRLVGL